tara:strand:- start:48 stop:290 length:243 start_codon:yes stop_codon:yes gene_type:complete
MSAFFGWINEMPKHSFGFLRSDLRDIEAGLIELIQSHRDWLNDERPSVAHHAEVEIARIEQLLDRVYDYRRRLELKEEEE